MLHFELLKTDGARGTEPGSHARRGPLTLTDGVVHTPIFMPVGTYGTVKGVMPRSLEEMGAQIILGNTFHLWMRPGLDVMAQFGGLHRFESWSKPILTDSGGFQVWSLGDMRKISEEGVKFASPVNGDKLFLAPEISVQIQTTLNSDIDMQFDECTPHDVKGHTSTERDVNAFCKFICRNQLFSFFQILDMHYIRIDKVKLFAKFSVSFSPVLSTFKDVPCIHDETDLDQECCKSS